MPLVFNSWCSLNWLTVGFLSFVLVLTFMFSEHTSVRNFLFISHPEVDVPELFLVARSPAWLSMGHYHLLCISVGFSIFLFFCGLNSSLQKPVTLRELGNASLLYEVPWFRKFLKFTWTILGSIITKYYFGYPKLSKYTCRTHTRMGFVSDEIFGSWASLKYLLV